MKTFIGPRLRRLRRDAKQTQAEMARTLGISNSYVNMLENNERSVSVPVLLRLFDAYGVDWREIADEDDAEEFGPELPPSGFRHLAMKVDQATQDGIRDRLVAAGYEEPQFYILNHGYCYSLYVFDPAGLLVEFTVDHDDVEQINADKKRTAHADLERWLAGDHTPNNEQFHR